MWEKGAASWGLLIRAGCQTGERQAPELKRRKIYRYHAHNQESGVARGGTRIGPRQPAARQGDAYQQFTSTAPPT